MGGLAQDQQLSQPGLTGVQPSTRDQARSQ